MVSDSVRYWVATTVSLAGVIVGVAGALGLGAPVSLDTVSVTMVYFALWVLYCLTYSAITWRVMGPADGATLARWLREDETDRRRRRRAESAYATGGPNGAVVLCGVALASALAVAVVPRLREEPVVVGLTVALVAATWLLLVIVYAMHYAREQGHLGGLGFPGLSDQDFATFLDFVYLSVHVATSLASSDVEVRTTSMRREVAVHSVIAFVFNAVVVALLVSVLVPNSA